MPVIIKALSLALRHYPALNTTVNQDCTVVTEKADHNIGVAMDTSEGLVVPNVKQVQVMKHTGLNIIKDDFLFVGVHEYEKNYTILECNR